MDDLLDKINQETEDYYNSIREGSGLKKIMNFSNELDDLDLILEELKDKKPSLNLPDKTPEEDEVARWLMEQTNKRRELERKGKLKIKW